jgi:hypothetical protein
LPVIPQARQRLLAPAILRPSVLIALRKGFFMLSIFKICDKDKAFLIEKEIL